MPTVVTTAMGDLVISNANPGRVARLRRHAEVFRDLPQCRELADHPRQGRQTCLTVTVSSGPDPADCPNVHRHV